MWEELKESARNKNYRDRTLSENMALLRAERPDEWQMDDFIRQAIKLEEEINLLRSNA